MKKIGLFAVLLFAVTALAIAQDEAQSATRTPEVARPAQSQQLPTGVVTHRGRVVVPPSSDRHRKTGAYTNDLIFVPEGQHEISSPTPDDTFAETPDSINCVYGTGPTYGGCVPYPLREVNNPSGGWGAIAVVEAYHDQNILPNLAYFSSYWGLPAASAEVVIANSSWGSNLGALSVNASCSGTPPEYPNNLGWDVEESLDAEWAHVMAPYAEIVIVEACSQSMQDLLYAEYVAGEVVNDFGGGDVSNSWGYTEACAVSSSCSGAPSGATEPLMDNYFFRYYWSHVTYLASAGDSGAEVLYPSASPWVVSVGGTQIDRDANENFLDESCWSSGGGGPSATETWQSPPNIGTGMGPWTDYQYAINSENFRMTPDISFEGSPNSGVYVYDTDEGGSWYIVGGTSVGSPSVAGILNKAGNAYGQGPTGGGFYITGENDVLYSQLRSSVAYGANFYDVTIGSNGHSAGTGYDECTGVGSPRGLLGK
jgi:kumamolisin